MISVEFLEIPTMPILLTALLYTSTQLAVFAVQDNVSHRFTEDAKYPTSFLSTFWTPNASDAASIFPVNHDS